MSQLTGDRLLTDAEARALLAWMKRVRHVDRVNIADLASRGVLTFAHAEFERKAPLGEDFRAFRRRTGL